MEEKNKNYLIFIGKYGIIILKNLFEVKNGRAFTNDNAPWRRKR